LVGVLVSLSSISPFYIFHLFPFFMFTTLQTQLKRASRLLPVALLSSFAVQAQVAPYTFTQTTGTYAPITGGTVLGDDESDDEQFNNPATPAGVLTFAANVGLPIGFSFQQGGVTYDRFAVNNNGWLALGNSSAGASAVTALLNPGTSNYAPIASTQTPPTGIISAFADDLIAQTGSSLSYSTIGTAPNRTLVVQWANYDYYTSSPTPTGTFNFQIRLNETSNTVVLSYGSFATIIPDAANFTAQVGLRGASNGDFNTRTTTTTWAASVAGTSNSDVMPVGDMTLPTSGLMYTFTPASAPANDAAVSAIYALGKVATPFASPVTVRAVVRNAGSTALTNLPVTLTVSGATTYTNTQTVASLGIGASTIVTFTAFPATATTGTNTLTVTVPADGLLTNNSQTFAQTLTASTLSYASGNTYTSGAGLTAAGSVIAVGYQSTGPAAITSVTPAFAGQAGTATGTPVTNATYQVLIYSAVAATGLPGTLLYTSPIRPRPAGVAGTIVTDVVPIPNISVNGAFFVGIKTVGANNLSIAYQTEVPLRAGTFLFTSNGTTWTDINTSTLNSRLDVEVGLGVVTAARNEALAATVGLYPNPAHRSFQLSVPAGALHAATATLSNSLGQVVLARQLSLPTAGGTTDFNVSGLAAGVYSLQLKSGNDLVVKRVVVE
jgi:hypothetical protein